jgi:hypothetical protein
LECVNRDLEEFAYVAGHDLQEPLRMVNIYTQLLLKQFPASREAGTYSRFVREGVRRMDELIKDLLADSRVIHSEREEAQLADLNESLEKALSVLRMNIEDTGAIISRNPLPSVSGNTRQLALVFRNILSNALKYRQPDRVPRVEIAVEDAPDQWIISVRDNGIGLSRSMQSASSGFSNACTKTPIPAPVSDWQSVSASSSGTAAASGQPATGMGRAQSSRSLAQGRLIGLSGSRLPTRCCNSRYASRRSERSSLPSRRKNGRSSQSNGSFAFPARNSDSAACTRMTSDPFRD